MDGIKEIKSIELASFTTTLTAVSVIFSVIIAIILGIAVAALVPSGGSVAIYLIPTIIVGTFMYGIYNIFCEGLLYNLLSKKMKTIAIQIKDNEISKISTTETAIMFSIIVTIQAILVYLVSVLVLPLFLSTVMQTLMFSGQQTIAYSIYQVLVLISQPATVALTIFGTFIITFVFTLIGCYIYNFLASSGRGVIVNLSKEDKFISIDSIDSLRLALAGGVVYGVLSLISAIINIVSGADIMGAVTSFFAGLIIGFVGGLLFAVFYNFISKKVGKIKLELIDF